MGASMGTASLQQAVAKLKASMGITLLQLEALEDPHAWVLDNYDVRLLADAMKVPIGGITEEHLKLARRRLQNFDFVGTVEELRTPEGRARISRGLGWSNHLTEAQLSDHFNTLHQQHKRLLSFTVEEEHFLEDFNKHDVALHKWVREKYAESSQGSE